MLSYGVIRNPWPFKKLSTNYKKCCLGYHFDVHMYYFPYMIKENEEKVSCSFCLVVMIDLCMCVLVPCFWYSSQLRNNGIQAVFSIASYFSSFSSVTRGFCTYWYKSSSKRPIKTYV